MPLSTIEIDDEVFVSEGTVGVGAVRKVEPTQLIISIEGYGDIFVGPGNIASAHDGKVVIDSGTLPQSVQKHLEHVHDGEMREPSRR